MINRKALNEALKPYKQKEIAKRMGITEQALINKLNGKSSFWVEEAAILGQLLNIDDKTFKNIFFAS